MSKILCFGEAVIEMVASHDGQPLADVRQFRRLAGGSPARVAVAIGRLGGSAYFAGKLGDDAFGRHLARVFTDNHVALDYVSYSREAGTALAFISHRDDGREESLLYRQHSAALQLGVQDVETSWFRGTTVFHFGSFALTHPPAVEATRRALNLAWEAGSLVSFDPSLQLSLWSKPQQAREVLTPLLSYVHLLKGTREEIRFLSQTQDEATAARRLLDLGIQLVVVSDGHDEASYYSSSAHGQVTVPAVKAVDAGGAQDAFMGGLLFWLEQQGPRRTSLGQADSQLLEDSLRFAQVCATLSSASHGIIASLPDLEAVQAALSS